MLGVQGSGDVGKLKEFLDGGKYGRNWFTQMIACLLDDIIMIEEFT